MQSDAQPERGELEVTTTYLEMAARPARPSVRAPLGKLALLRAEQPTVSFYRYLYDTVGGPWLWYERRRMSDAELRAIVCHEAVEIDVLYVGGVPAGYSELDGRSGTEVELAYFGLVPEFIGRGYGWYLLNATIDRAWGPSTTRVWVHTCNLDHPRALLTYQRAGFVAYERETERIADPRRQGWI